MLKPPDPRSVDKVQPETQWSTQPTRAGTISTVPSLRKLRYLLTVAEELHFRKAAEKLHVSQPVLSRQVRQCEEEFGFRILERDHHYVALTRAGRMFVTDLDRILRCFEDDLKKAILRAAETSCKVAQECVVGHSPFTGLRLRRIALDVGRKYVHGFRLRLRILPTSELLKAIKSEMVLAGITYAPIPDEDLETISIQQEHWSIVVPSHGRFLSCQVARTKDFQGLPIISNGADRTHPALDQNLREHWAAAGFVPRIIAEVTSPHEAFDLVRAGEGIAFLPEGVCEGLPVGIRAIRITDLPPLEVVLICRSADVEFARAFGSRLRHSLVQKIEGRSLAGPTHSIVGRKPVVEQKSNVKLRSRQSAS